MRLVIVLAVALSACRGDPVKCEAVCRKYITLVYWSDAEPQLAAAPPDKRDALRKNLQARFENTVANGMDLCIARCQSANNKDDNACLLAAKTAEQARACFE